MSQLPTNSSVQKETVVVSAKGSSVNAVTVESQPFRVRIHMSVTFCGIRIEFFAFGYLSFLLALLVLHLLVNLESLDVVQLTRFFSCGQNVFDHGLFKLLCFIVQLLVIFLVGAVMCEEDGGPALVYVMVESFFTALFFITSLFIGIKMALLSLNFPTFGFCGNEDAEMNISEFSLALMIHSAYTILHLVGLVIGIKLAKRKD